MDVGASGEIVMILPGDAIGISDVLAHRECARRMSYGMRRHNGRGEQSDRLCPEAGSPATAYGSAIHYCIHAVEAGEDDGRAIAGAYKRWGHMLQPADRARLQEDLNIYRARDFPGTRTVASEDELRVPLFCHNGRQIYFRFKVDRLYELVSAPGTFIHIDYKSSAHPKSQKDVDCDIQLWSYNWAICEYFPECQDLSQFYDQLRFGQLPTRKNDAQRAEIKAWLIDAVTAVIEDDSIQPDGLLDYRYNQWCPWCPIMESCGVVKDLTDFALTRIAALAPIEKQGRKTLVRLQNGRVGEYVDELERVRTARAVLKRFDEAVRDMVKQMPAARREKFGFDLRERTNTIFTPEAVASLHDALGDERFYRLVNLTKLGLESELADDPATLGWALGLGDRVAGPALLVRKDAA